MLSGCETWKLKSHFFKPENYTIILTDKLICKFTMLYFEKSKGSLVGQPFASRRSRPCLKYHICEWPRLKINVANSILHAVMFFFAIEGRQILFSRSVDRLRDKENCNSI